MASTQTTPRSRGVPRAEYDRRLGEVRALMAHADLAGCLISAPENVYYLTGLDHQGYFAYESLVLPLEGVPILITRKMEHATVKDQVPWVRHFGYSDGIEPLPAKETAPHDVVLSAQADGGEAAGLRPWEMSYGVSVQGPVADAGVNPIRETVHALEEAGLAKGRLGMEMRASFLPYHIAKGVEDSLPETTWIDCSGLVEDCRIVQSPLELAFTREAARITDSMVLSGIAAAGAGVREEDVIASIYDAMFRRGGTYPGFVPLVRSTRTIQHEHGTWSLRRLRKGDMLFLEMAGCVKRYHAPIGRLVFIGSAPSRAHRMRGICGEAMDRAAKAIRPGVRADEVYRAWESALKEAGLPTYHRHHCGYAVGIGFPPSWSGSGTPQGLRRTSSLELKEGMVFHLMSWLLRTGRGDFFLSDTVVVTEKGCEFLTTASREVCVR